MEYISIRQIMDDVLDHPMLEDLPYQTAIKYAIRFIRTMGMPKLFELKTAILHIEDHTCKLPCDIYSVLHVKDCKTQRLMRESVSHFDITKDFTIDPVYRIQGDMLVSSIREHDVELSYRMMNTDESGYPLIVNNEDFITALEDYIKERWFTVLFDQKKIGRDVLINAQKDSAWSKGKAKTSLLMPSVEEMRDISNLMNELIPRKHADNGFRSLGRPEPHNL